MSKLSLLLFYTHSYCVGMCGDGANDCGVRDHLLVHLDVYSVQNSLTLSQTLYVFTFSISAPGQEHDFWTSNYFFYMIKNNIVK